MLPVIAAVLGAMGGAVNGVADNNQKGASNIASSSNNVGSSTGTFIKAVRDKYLKDKMKEDSGTSGDESSKEKISLLQGAKDAYADSEYSV